jgi:hypothetical protein
MSKIKTNRTWNLRTVKYNISVTPEEFKNIIIRDINHPDDTLADKLLLFGPDTIDSVDYGPLEPNRIVLEFHKEPGVTKRKEVEQIIKRYATIVQQVEGLTA